MQAFDERHWWLDRRSWWQINPLALAPSEKDAPRRQASRVETFRASTRVWMVASRDVLTAGPRSMLEAQRSSSPEGRGQAKPAVALRVQRRVRRLHPLG